MPTRKTNRRSRTQFLGNSYAQLSGVDKIVVSLCKNSYFRELMGADTTIREIVNDGGWSLLEDMVDNGFQNLAIDQANGEAAEIISVIQMQVMDKADFHDLADYFEGTNL